MTALQIIVSKESAWFRDLVQWRVDMDVCVVQALRNVLVEECANDQVAYVAISRAGVEDVALKELFVGSKFVLDRAGRSQAIVIVGQNRL